jgi:hypothetical protein
MKNWIWSVTQANWPTVKAKSVWAINKKGASDMVKNGDRLVFYVVGTNYFTGGFEVVSDWHEPTPTLVWPESTRSKESADEIDLKEIQTGWANVDKLIPLLKFWTKTGRGAKGLYLKGRNNRPANFAQSISDEDFETIIRELKKVQEEPDFKRTKRKEDGEKELIEIKKISKFGSDEEVVTERRSIEKICSYIDDGDIGVPDFQRPFKWKDNQIEQLWESIFRSYYIGTLLYWRTTGKYFAATPLHGAPKLSKKSDLVLDGQQRLTAIYYAIKAPDVNLPRKTQPYRYFVNINALLDDTKPSDEIVDSYPMKKVKKKQLDKKEVQFSQLKFPIYELKDRNYKDWLRDFEDYLEDKKGKSKEEAQRYFKNLDQIFAAVYSEYKIPIVVLPDELELENVATVFERINSKGTPLGTFDLLNARFRLYKIVLQNLWDKTKDDYPNVEKYAEEIEKLNYYILQAMSLVKKGAIRKKEILRLDEVYKTSGKFDDEQKKEFEDDWNDISRLTSEVIKRLSDRQVYGIVDPKFVPYTVMIPIFVAMLKKAEGREDEPTCKNKIRYWYWNNVFMENYSGSTDSQGESDFKAMKDWFENDSQSPFNFEPIEDIESSKQGAADYNGIMCLIAKKGAKDFRKDDPADYGQLEDHHIFPKAKWKEYGLPEQSEINSIFNRTLIFEKTNRQIHDKNPSQYIRKIMKEQKIKEEEMRERLSTHLISEKAFECMKNDDFYGFVAERKITILNEIKKIVKYK